MAKKRLRFTVSLLAFFIFIGIIAPWGIGHFLHKTAVNRIARFNEVNSRFGFTLRLKNYQNGIYRSFATIELMYQPMGNLASKKDNPTIQTFFEESIQHGPIMLDVPTNKIYLALAKIESQITWPETSLLKIDQENLVINSIVDYLGKQTASVSIDTISGSIKKGFVNNAINEDVFFEFNDIKLNFSCYLRDPFPTYDMGVKESKIKIGKSNLRLNGLIIDSRVNTLATADITYNSTISVDKLECLEPQFSVNNIGFQLKGTHIKGDYAYDAEMGFKEMVVNGIIYGPGELNYSLDGLSDKFIREFANLKQNQSPEATLQAIEKLIKTSNLDLKMNIKKCKLNLPGGELFLQSGLHLKGSEDANPTETNGKLGFMVSKEAAFNLAKRTVGNDAALEYLSFLTNNGFFIDTGEQYESYLLYKNGQLYRNGIPSIENVYLYSFNSFKRPFSSDKELLVAIWCNDVEAVKTLLKSGINLNSAGTDIKNPLPVAAFMGNKEIVDLLLQHKIPVNQIDYMGNTALSLAARRGNIQIVKDLLANGAKPDVYNVNGWTPLQEAAENGHLELVELLLQQKVEINKADTENRTALFWAAQKGDNKIVQLLLNKGANPSIASVRGTTPRDIAQNKGYTRTVEILDNP